MSFLFPGSAIHKAMMIVTFALVLGLTCHAFSFTKATVTSTTTTSSMHMASTVSKEQVKADYDNNVMNTYGRYPLTIR